MKIEKFPKNTPIYFSQDWYECIGVSIGSNCMLVQNWTMGMTDTYDAIEIPRTARKMRRLEVEVALKENYFKCLEPRGGKFKINDILEAAE